MGILLAPSVSFIFIYCLLKVFSFFIFYFFYFRQLDGLGLNPPIFRSVRGQYMTKIKSVRRRFQKVAVQFENKGDVKIIDYKDIPLEDPDRFIYNLSSM